MPGKLKSKPRSLKRRASKLRRAISRKTTRKMRKGTRRRNKNQRKKRTLKGGMEEVRQEALRQKFDEHIKKLNEQKNNPVYIAEEEARREKALAERAAVERERWRRTNMFSGSDRDLHVAPKP